MICAACGKENREGRKFCSKCGAPLALQCPACGAANEPDESFCGECGGRLQGTEGSGVRNSTSTLPPTPGSPHPSPAGERKVISVIFADLMNSTALQERLDPESVNRVMDAYYQAVRGPVDAAGGTVVQLLGDGVLCAFGIPRIAEDDALRAVRAAVGIQQAFREFLQAQQWLNVPIGLRVAVNTGEVVVSDEHPAGLGDPLNVAARLQQEARDGEVLIGPATRRLVAEAVTLERAGVFALKGRAETVSAYRVVSLERPRGATAAFVGRDEELARLNAVYEAAVATPAARLAVLLGSPGLGKSRLIDELGQRLGDGAQVIAAQCDAAGGATFAPVAAALREWLPTAGASMDRSDPSDQLRATLETTMPADVSAEASAKADRTRIINGITALLAGSPASPEETFFVIRRFLAGLARQRPVVLVIDDLQWAEPLLLDLVEHLIQWGSGVPLLVLIGARPELRDRRSSLATVGGFVSDVVTLSGLDAGAAMRLAANVIGATDLPATVAAKVLATSEGNPLFVGELVRMLVDEGAIEKQGERWAVGANLAALEMPPTIHALLAARIERLEPEERTILERAAVVGRHFSRSAVMALLGRNGTALDARLEALRRTELIEPDSGWFLGEPVLRFHHVLIRDAAYRRLLKGTRAELHERLANWIEAQVEDAPEHDETIGWHLEQAHQLLHEIGPLDETGKALGERAAKRLSAAGRRALARDDVPVAADLLGRAIGCLDSDDPGRADLALDWCEALLSAGDVVPAAKAIDELARNLTTNSLTTDDLSRLSAWRTCFAGQLTAMTAPQELQVTADAVAGAAAEFANLGDAAGEAKAHSVHAQALARLGKVGACEAALDKALAAARKAGDRRRANAVLAGAPLAALWGPSPVTRASGRCLDVVRVLRITQGAPAVEAVALSCQGVLEALRGRTEAARRMIASSRKMVEELGIAHRLLEADVFAGRIDLLEGDATAAERNLRSAYGGLRELGLGIDAARAGALLGRALLAQDRAEEAEALSRESEALAGDDLQAAIAWRGVRAEALAQRGEHTEAIELAKAGVAIAAATDALLDHAAARLALTAVLRSAGRGQEADAEERRAIELWQAKGASLLAERAHSGSENAARKPLPRPLSDPERGETVLPSLAGKGASGLGRERRIRPNATAAWSSRYEAAFAARDVEALVALHSDDFWEIHHPTGATYGHAGVSTSLRKLMRARDPWFRLEPLATLGESLALVRRWFGAAGGGRFNVGPYDREEISLTDVDAHGRIRYVEVFAPDRLNDALVRLYEYYTVSLPLGAERDRAAATARVMGLVLAAESGLMLAVERGKVDDLATEISPGFESIDHRPLSTWSGRGGEAFVQHVRALHEVADDVAMPVVDVLALEPNAILIRRMHSGTERVGGGSYERPHLGLWVTGNDGKLERYEIFDVEREVEALARFDELVGGRPPLPGGDHRGVESPPGPLLGKEGKPVLSAVSGFATLATQTAERMQASHDARDRAGFTACIASDLRYSDRRRTVQEEFDRAAYLEYILSVHDMPWNHHDMEVIATRGERLVLIRVRLEVAGGDVGPSEIPSLLLIEANSRGEAVAIVRFDLEDIDAAYAELDARYEAGEGAAYTAVSALGRDFSAALARRDWDALASLFAPGIVADDHRLVGWGTRHGPIAFIEALRAMVELAPDVRSRADHMRMSSRGILAHITWMGTRDGGAFESPFVWVAEIDAHGKYQRLDFYDPHHVEKALARFAELGDADRPPLPRPALRLRQGYGAQVGKEGGPFANAASRIPEQIARAWATRDWETFKAAHDALHSPTHHYDDRRRLMRIRTPLETSLEGIRVLFDVPKSRWIMSPLATRGERLALTHSKFEGNVDAGGGDLTIDFLALGEVDEQGRFETESVLFDPDDLDAAYAELDARFAAGEGAAHPLVLAAHRSSDEMVYARNWDGFAALLGPGFAYHDHRLLGWGTTGRDVESFIRILQSLFELSQNARYRRDHLRLCSQGLLSQTMLVGTREGGSFENPLLDVMEVDEEGKVRRHDTYDVDDYERALARFEETSARPEGSSRADSGRYDRAQMAPFENAAFRVFRDAAAIWAGDHPDRSVEAFANPGFRCRDRRRVVQLDMSRDEFVQFSQSLVEMKSRNMVLELLGTAGESLALIRNTVEVEDGDIGTSAVESLSLIEIDGQGRMSMQTRFDPEDEDKAFELLNQRWLEIEDVRTPVVVRFTRGFREALERRDWDALAGWFAPGLIGHDHRLVSWGTLRGPRAFLESVRQMVELASDARMRAEHMRAAQRGALHSTTWIGTRDGGAFESPYVSVLELNAEGKALRLDFYDPQHLDRARARFAEIVHGEPSDSRVAGVRSALDRGRDPLAAIAKPNAANAALERFQAAYDLAFESGDWSAVREVYTPQVVFEDRRRWVLVSGGRELLVDSLRQRVATGARFERTRVANAGNRIAIERMLWSGGAPDGRFEIEYLAVVEVDEAGRLDAAILFDLQDARAAQREAWARWSKLEPEIADTLATVAEAIDQFNAQDRRGARAPYADDLVVEDHRRTGIGRIEGGDADADRLVALWQLTPTTQIELGWFWPRIGPHGGLFTVRRTGEISGGGAVESVHLALLLHEHGLWKRLELFELEDLDAALARFGELAPQ